jgi:hypothetical protein
MSWIRNTEKNTPRKEKRLTGRLRRKNRNLPERECSTAFSIKSTMVVLLNLVKLPKLKLPADWKKSYVMKIRFVPFQLTREVSANSLTYVCYKKDFLYYLCTVFHSTLLHLPPLRIPLRMLGSNPGLLRLWHCQSDALTTRLDLIHNLVRSVRR